jgi:ribosome-binding factor A
MAKDRFDRLGEEQSISSKGLVRIKKAERLVEQLVGEYFRARLPRNSPVLLSVTRVELSRDLKYGKVFIHALAVGHFSDEPDLASQLGAQTSQIQVREKSSKIQNLEEKALALLDEHRPRIQAFVSKEMKSKFVPKLSFKYDYGWERGQKVDGMLRNLRLP